MKKTIEVADDIATDPVAYLVMHFDPSHGVWEVFDDLYFAEECAKRQEAEHLFWCNTEKVWDIYPLYAGHPFKRNTEAESQSVRFD